MDRKLKINRQKIIISVLVVLLIISVSYIVVYKLQAKTQQAFQDGYDQGINDVVVTLYQQTENCQSTAIRIGNVTREVIDTACLISK